jgi:hypothetical protein
MPRKPKIDLDGVRACLDTICPKCGHRITPADVKLVSELKVKILNLSQYMQKGWAKKVTVKARCAAVLMKHITLTLIVLLSSLAFAQDQTPEILSVAEVVVGAQRIETLYAHVLGKWSDAEEHLAVMSTEIHCYERFGFCEEADATYLNGEAGETLNTLDILRWDKRELIAVDSSPICVVNTLRIDFATKKVTITMALKGETKDKFCNDIKATTAFLGGVDDEVKKMTRSKKK